MVRLIPYLLLLTFSASSAFAQSIGTMNIQGPSTGGPLITPSLLNSAVNVQQTSKVDTSGGTLTGGTLAGTTAITGGLSSTKTLGYGAGSTSGPTVGAQWFQNSATGTATDSNVTNFYNWTITNDGVDASAATNGVFSFEMQEACCGSTAKNGRQLFTAFLNINHLAGVVGNYTAGQQQTQVSVNLGGLTGLGNGIGNIIGNNPRAIAATGATFQHRVIGEEIDTAIATGASAELMNGLNITLAGSHATNPSIAGTALIVGAGSGGIPGWDFLITDGSYDGFPAMKTTGTWFSCYAHANTGTCGAMGSFADLSKYTSISNFILNGPNGTHFIDGSFNIDAGTIKASGIPVTGLDNPHPGYVASDWYLPVGYGSIATGAAVTANVIRCTFGGVANKLTIGSLGAKVTTNTSSTNFQLAIYTASAGRPATLLSSTGNMSSASATTVTGALGASKQVGPGGTAASDNLFFCFNADNSSVVFVSINSSQAATEAGLMGSATAANVLTGGAMLTGMSCSGAACTGASSTFNTWPASLAGTTWTDVIGLTMPAIAFQAASVP